MAAHSLWWCFSRLSDSNATSWAASCAVCLTRACRVGTIKTIDMNGQGNANKAAM